MRSLASTGNRRAAELIDKADELDKMTPTSGTLSRSLARGCGPGSCGARSLASRSFDDYPLVVDTTAGSGIEVNAGVTIAQNPTSQISLV
jgi:hypothetical protein